MTKTHKKLILPLSSQLRFLRPVVDPRCLQGCVHLKRVDWLIQSVLDSFDKNNKQRNDRRVISDAMSLFNGYNSIFIERPKKN